MATFEGTRSPKCCPWTNQGYLTFPHTPPWPRPDPREAYTRAYPNRVGPADLTLEGPKGSLNHRCSCPWANKNAAMEISPVQAIFTQAKADFKAQGKATAAQTMERGE